MNVVIENSYPLERALVCRQCGKKLWRMPLAVLELLPTGGSYDLSIMEWLDSHISCCDSPNWNWMK